MKVGMPVLSMMIALASASACRNAGSDADAAKARGLAHADQGKYDLAILEYNSAIKMKPEDADAYNSRGNAFAAKHESDRAIQDYDTAIRLRPNSPFAYNNRGAVLATKDKFDRAIADFDQAIKLKPDYAGALNSRGFAYQLKGDYAHAIQDFSESIKLTPEAPAAYRNRANAEFIVGRFADAASDLERSLKFHQTSVNVQPTKRLNETGAYTVVWLHVAKMRQGQDDTREFAANSALVDSASWPAPVIRFYEGKLTADRLVAGTANADPKEVKDQRCGAEFFAGQAALWRKQMAEARKRFEATREFCSERYTEHAAAAAELARLGIAGR